MNYRPVQSRILITIQRPELWALSLLFVLCVVVLMAWLSYLYGQRVAGYDKAEAVNYIEALEQQIENLKSEYADSQRQTAMLERNSTIDDGASEQLKISLAQAQDEVLELKKELSFYKSIVAPGDSKRSLMIQTIQLKADATGVYQYKIMVSQRGQNDTIARGKIDVTIGGVEQGQKKLIRLSDVSGDVKGSIGFGFKYFQNFTGTMTLPATFQPEYMRVEVKPSSSKIDSIDEQFAWADLTAGGE
ncbi:MAG: GAS domain-containing protein [Gammaproteobacteria bacterium]|nr:GAS domain-containing protein [Gammaproteobacteria bacterium]